LSRTGLVFNPVFQEHDTGEHPENMRRLSSIIGLLHEKGIDRKTRLIAPRAASIQEVCRVHKPDYVRHIEHLACHGGDWLDPDTYVSRGSYQAAIYASGAVLSGIEKVNEGLLENAFALVRPPGHHASAERAMGFCLFNNVAVGAAHLVEILGLARVAIIDFDVHHGNGTQAVFNSDRRVMYCSVHQSPLYPGTGFLEDTGTGMAAGSKINIPLPPGSGDIDYEEAFNLVVIPSVRRFSPQFILVSAGFDAHNEDGLASMQVSVKGYAKMASSILQLARDCCGGKLVLTLEGGYNLKALSYSVMAVIRVLLGEPDVEDPFPPSSPSEGNPAAGEIIRKAAGLHCLR
jgi:acetoin utilization deacetylase AcuC-like enzyme